MSARDPQGAPPAYETVANGGEGIVLQNEHDQIPLLDARDVNAAESKKRFSSRKFILQWLGIDYGCSFICLLFSLFLFGGGIAVIVLTLVAGPGVKQKSCESLTTAKVLTIIAGGVVMMMATYWPMIWFWHQSRRNRSFTPFICYAWFLSLCYVGILCALAVPVYEHRDLMFDPDHNQNEGCMDLDWTASIPLWTFVPMGGMMVIFFAVSFLVCGCCSGAGSIW